MELAVRQGDGAPVKAEAIATAQVIPYKFLEGILADLRRGGLVVSQRGGSGGYVLARSADAITVADVIRTVDGPIVSVRGERPPGTGTEAGGGADGLGEPVETARAALRESPVSLRGSPVRNTTLRL